MPRTARRVAAAGLIASSLALTACSGGSRSGAGPSPSTGSVTPSASASAATLSTKQRQVIHAYNQFWAALSRASRLATDNARLSVLVPVATDPELTSLIIGLHRQHALHRVLFGVPVARVGTVNVRNGKAELTDCQDASRSGIETTSGKKLVVGAGRNPVSVTLLLRGSVWKVATVAYPKAGKC
jgi:hypothetical protein